VSPVPAECGVEPTGVGRPTRMVGFLRAHAEEKVNVCAVSWYSRCQFDYGNSISVLHTPSVSVTPLLTDERVFETALLHTLRESATVIDSVALPLSGVDSGRRTLIRPVTNDKYDGQFDSGW
jgi:hypothetical protein